MKLNCCVLVCIVCVSVELSPIIGQSILLHGTIINPIEKKVSISYYDDDLKQQNIKDEYVLDGKNNFLSSYDFNNPSMIEIQYGKNRMKMYIEPGDEISIKFDRNDFFNSWEISGRGSTNNMFLDSLNKRYPISKRYQYRSSDFEHHVNSIDSLLLHIQSYINVESKNHKLSDKFLSYLHSDILFQAAINKIFYIQKNYTMSGNIDEHTSSYLKFMDEINLNSENNLYVESFPKLIFMYLDCRYQIENPKLLLKIRTTNIANLPESERVSFFTTIANIRHRLAKRLFKGRTLDYYTSKELIGLFNNGWIEPFDKIYEDYKNEQILNEYTKFIDEALEDASRLQLGKSAPNFKLYDLDNNIVSLSDIKGKVILINFWASWCKPCRASIPKLKNIQSEFTNKDIIIVNICLDENIQAGKLSIEKEQLAGVHLFSDGFGSQTARDYNIQSIPQYFLLEKEGNIVNKTKGSFNAKTIIKEIQKLL